MNNTRYPYTYACDLIRSIAGYNDDGTKLSRSDASKIRSFFADLVNYSYLKVEASKEGRSYVLFRSSGSQD